jgi:hypothetical protein
LRSTGVISRGTPLDAFKYALFELLDFFASFLNALKVILSFYEDLVSTSCSSSHWFPVFSSKFYRTMRGGCQAIC